MRIQLRSETGGLSPGFPRFPQVSPPRRDCEQTGSVQVMLPIWGVLVCPRGGLSFLFSLLPPPFLKFLFYERVQYGPELCLPCGSRR